MKITKYNNLTKDMIKELTELLSEAFKHNEFIYTHLLGENINRLNRFMELEIEYNNGFADFYTLVNNDGKLVAAVIYLPVGCEALGISSALKRGKLFTVLRFFAMQPIKYTKRMIEFNDLENKYWYKEPFITLDVLVSLEKGCGKTLVEATIGNYSGQNIALNSSVPVANKNEDAYYSQFGFEAYKDIQLGKYKTAMMVKKANNS